MAIQRKVNTVPFRGQTVRRVAAPSNMAVKAAAPAPVANQKLQEVISVGATNADKLKNINGAPTTIADTTFYINVDAANFAGLQNILDANTKKLVGITNFDGNKLNAGRNLVVQEIRLLYTTFGERLENADWQNLDRLPGELQNAEFRWLQGGKQLLSFPLSDLQGQKFEDFRKIFTSPFIQANEEMEMQIEFPKGVSVPAAALEAPGGDMVQQFLRFEFRVGELKN